MFWPYHVDIELSKITKTWKTIPIPTRIIHWEHTHLYYKGKLVLTLNSAWIQKFPQEFNTTKFCNQYILVECCDRLSCVPTQTNTPRQLHLNVCCNCCLYQCGFYYMLTLYYLGNCGQIGQIFSLHLYLTSFYCNFCKSSTIAWNSMLRATKFLHTWVTYARKSLNDSEFNWGWT